MRAAMLAGLIGSGAVLRAVAPEHVLHVYAGMEAIGAAGGSVIGGIVLGAFSLRVPRRVDRRPRASSR